MTRAHNEAHRRGFHTILRLVLLACLVHPRIAVAQDGRTLLLKVDAAYQQMNTYEGSSSVEVTYYLKGKAFRKQGLSVQMKVRRPNRISLDFASPKGSRLVISDGKEFFVYAAASNQFTRTATASTFRDMLVPLLFGRAGVQAGLDPLYFLTLNELPKPLSDLKLKGSGTSNGKPVLIVTGVTRTAKQTVKGAKGQTVTFPPTTESWTWWINKQTMLLEKIELRNDRVTMVMPARQGKKIVGRPAIVSRVVTHTVTAATPNPNLDDRAFAFHPPAGATEHKSVQELLNNGK